MFMVLLFSVQCLRDDKAQRLHILGHRYECRHHDPDVAKKPEECARYFHLSEGNVLLVPDENVKSGVFIISVRKEEDKTS